jgi:hypothetical protein
VPVRGTTAWRHARLERKVVATEGRGSPVTGTKVFCAWDDCDRDGFELYKVVVNYAKPGFRPYVTRYVFCSERHRLFFLNASRDFGNLPAGTRHSLLPGH